MLCAPTSSFFFPTAYHIPEVQVKDFRAPKANLTEFSFQEATILMQQYISAENNICYKLYNKLCRVTVSHNNYNMWNDMQA